MSRFVPISSIFVVSLLLLISFNNCAPGFSTLADSSALSLGSNAGEAPPVDDGKMGVYFAIGHLGRSLRSCDDGRTWINDHSDDDTKRCYLATTDPNFIDCDHTANRGMSVDSGDGWLFRQTGWGHNGLIERSRDGVTWETLRANGWGAGLVYFEKTLFTAFYSFFSSADQGKTFSSMTTIPSGFLVPTMGKISNKLLVLRGRATGTATLAFSHDRGATWIVPSIPMEWWNAGMAMGNGVMVAGGITYGSAENVGTLSVSKDGGATWTNTEVFRGRNLVWSMSVRFDGQNFVALRQGRHWKSADGENWTDQPATLNGSPLAATAAFSAVRNERTGTYAGFSGTFGQFYQSQKAYRSENGIDWVTLGASAFTGGHPINSITNAILDKSACAAVSQ